MKTNLVRALDRTNIKHANSVATFLLNQLAAADKRFGEDKGFWLTKAKLPYKDPRHPVSFLAAMLVAGDFVTRRGETDADRYYFYPTPKLLKYHRGHLEDISTQLKTQEQEIARLRSKES